MDAPDDMETTDDDEPGSMDEPEPAPGPADVTPEELPDLPEGAPEAAPQVDSTAVPAEPLDTTKIGFMTAVSRVKMFRRDMQFACDSLAWTDLDSLVRLYRDPKVYNEGNRQYSADSIYVVIRNGAMEKASLQSNAFIATQEDTLHYDQIRGAEVVAYFDSTGVLKRFDSLGGASALFFLEENNTLATVNKVESKMLSAQFSNGNLEKVFYYESANNDAYPVVQLPKNERLMKGFKWNPEERPSGKEDITPLVPRKSQRLEYERRDQANFPYTEVYFKGYMAKVRREIEIKDSLAVVRDRERKIRERERQRLERERELLAAADSLARASADSLSLASAADSLGVAADSLGVAADSLGVAADSLGVAADSLGIRDGNADGRASSSPDAALSRPGALDSLSHTEPKAPTPEEIAAAEKARIAAEKEAERARIKAEKEAEKARKAAERAEKKAKRQAELEAKWAEEDRIWAEKQQAKRDKELQKQRDRKLKVLKKRAAEADKERQILNEYIREYRAKKVDEAAREFERSLEQRQKAPKKASLQKPSRTPDSQKPSRTPDSQKPSLKKKPAKKPYVTDDGIDLTTKD